jgi:polysaccharide biosynthesis/export protein
MQTASLGRAVSSILFVVFTAIFLIGCLRYVPSRKEIDSQRGSIPSNIGGSEEFKAYEAKLRKEAESLAQERSTLLQAQSNSTYRIGPRDLLSIEVFGLSDLAGDFEVTPAGTVSVALVGDVPVVGLTLAEARDRLNHEYKKFVRQPQVKLSVKDYQSQRISVVGEVNKPGMYALKTEGRLITDLLAEAGGKTDRAGNRVILIPAPRGDQESGAPQTRGIEIDLEDLTGGVDRRPLLIPVMAGDILTIPEAGSFQVDGEVNKPGSFPLPPKISTQGAIASAGGFTYSANVNNVEVVRDIGNGRKASMTVNVEDIALNGGRDIRLREGDIVRVPSESGRFARRQVVEVLNGMFRFGVSGSGN